MSSNPQTGEERNIVIIDIPKHILNELKPNRPDLGVYALNFVYKVFILVFLLIISSKMKCL